MCDDLTDSDMDIIKRINNTALGYNQQTLAMNKRYPVFDENETKDIKQSEVRFGETQYVVPLRLALSSNPDDMFTLPLDPVVSVNGSNTIVKREVAKSEIRGTVKEKWNQNDLSISVSGVLTTTDPDDSSKTVDGYAQRLLHFLLADEALIIECDVVNNVLDVQRVVVEKFDFPFTKGVENQSFSFTLVSDDSYNLETE